MSEIIINKNSKPEDFIDAIENLNENSTKEAIEKLLFYDMKQETNYDLLKNDVDIINFNYISNDKITEENKIEYLKNWLRYKILTKLTSFDSDKTKKTKAFLKRFLEVLLPNRKITYNSDRTFEITTEEGLIFLDTDTMNSYATTFHKFIGKYNDVEILKKIDDIYENGKKDKKLFDEFIKFAKLQNTIGNFVFVPKGYNAPRYKVTKDYWDLTMIELDKSNEKNFSDKENSKDFKWYFKNKKLLLIEVKQLFYEGHSKDNPMPKEENMKECVQNMNKLIVNRGLEMMCTINKSLRKNTNIESIKKQYN